MSSIDFAKSRAYFRPIIPIALKTTSENEARKRGTNNYIIRKKYQSLS